MAINKQSYQITGMRQDNLVGTGYSNKFAHEIMNLRLNTVGDYTTASWTTEEGTLLKPVDWVDAPSDALALLVGNDTEANPIVPIGQAVINDQWIVFATQTLSGRVGYDFIFKYWYQEGTNQLMGTILYAGNLNFDAKHPCETLAFYENENVQKVYWTDGKNQPRVINIKGVKYNTGLDGQFDFVQEVTLREKVTITKQTAGAGLFPPGTVKYAVTYYKKYGQETNIVYDSPLYYPIKGQRGCNPEELSGDSFEVRVDNIDNTHGFDYIRLYSIVRTTEDATPIVRIVADKELDSLPIESDTQSQYWGKQYALFVDTNTTGEIVDPTILQYVGGKEIIAQTFDQKNNTMFLGNIELTQKSALEALEGESLEDPNAGFTLGDFTATKHVFDNHGYDTQYMTDVDFAYDNEKAIGIRVNNAGQDSSFYQHSNQLTATNHWHSYDTDGNRTMRSHNGDSRKIKIFKYGEYYRFGIQFQDTKGSWSEVIHLKDASNNIKPVTDEWSSVGVFGIFRYTLPNDAVVKLLANKYIKARLVCCYPNNTDRTVLAQGVINPTIKNKNWNDNHSPDVFASWFFRPHDTGTTVETIPYRGTLSNSSKGNCEIQSIYSTGADAKDSFSVVENVLTINSPEIEIDESIRTLHLDEVGIAAIGYVPIQSWASYVYVEASNPFPSFAGNKGTGLHAQGDIKRFNSLSASTGSHYVNQGEWKDRDYWRSDSGHIHEYPWPIYAFHRKGSLANYIKDVNPWSVTIKDEDPSWWEDLWGDETDDVEYKISSGSILQSKVLSHLLYSGTSVFQNSSDFQYLNSSGFTIFDSGEVVPTKVNDLIYYGNLNSIAPVRDEFGKVAYEDEDDHIEILVGSYPIKLWSDRASGILDGNGPDGDGAHGWASDPVPITYNSTPHAVFYSDNFQTLEPSLLGSSLKSYLILADIIKPTSEDTRFGGISNSNNLYLPCGPVVDLRECENTSPTLIGLEGDHYFMRYDCLKTYPRSIEDTNQIVEILSFMCETRINLDGRYDRNRGLSDNTTITNTNFNLINKSYTQSNNFFTYTTLDEDTSILNKFANLITWTKDKVSGEDVDTWTNITLASTADAEGVCGGINKIVNVNDTLYSFQDHGIAQIGYNEKTALSTLEGVPLEIANSGKFSGLKYVTKEIGCQNKWSISLSKNGAFFIDDSRQELLTLGQGVTSLSTANGLDAFLIQQLPDSEHFTPWTPFNPGNFVSYYDKLGNDVLYINRDYCLAWNEQSHTFTSFYSYNNVPLMANIGTHLLMWDINTPLVFNLDSADVEEEVITYTPTVTTTTEEIEHTTTTTETIVENPIFNDDNYLDLVFYHYKAGSSMNSGLGNTPTNGYFVNHPMVIYRSNTLANIRNSWLRTVIEPTNYGESNYTWNAHFILSLEFRKNGEPFIIQYEIDGVHTGMASGNLGWVVEPALPTIKIRTQNVSDEEFENIKLFLGGYNQPTFNSGNVDFTYYDNSNNGYYHNNGTQPWDAVDDGFVTEIGGQDRELLCIVKLYDLTKVPVTSSDATTYVSSNPIESWLFQGDPFRLATQDDQMSDVDTSMYNPEDLRYNTTTTVETIEHTTTTWTPVTEVKTTTHYVVHSSSSNIWAARENNYHCCEFFGHYKPYWMTLVCDGMTADGNAFPADKVFNNIEYRADVFDRITGLPRVDISLPVFDKKAAYNGYQAYKEFPIEGVRKFNTWRVQLPRATYYENGQFVTTRDRIRNPFCYIKLLNSNSIPLPNRMILHDLAVYFDMK